jgi:hypothetical protein
LRSSGLDCEELINKFRDDWLNQNREYLNKLTESQFLVCKNNFYSLTPNGYAVCDELLLKF